MAAEHGTYDTKRIAERVRPAAERRAIRKARPAAERRATHEESMSQAKPSTLQDLRNSGWVSRTVKEEMRENLVAALSRGDQLFPGIVGYDDTVIPEVVNAILAGHDMLFL